MPIISTALSPIVIDSNYLWLVSDKYFLCVWTLITKNITAEGKMSRRKSELVYMAMILIIERDRGLNARMDTHKKWNSL